MANLNGVAGDVLAQNTTYLMNRFGPFVDKAEEFYNILQALKTGKLTIDRVQILEDLRVAILPETPPDTPCDVRVAKQMSDANKVREAKQNKTPLTELKSVEKPELVEVNNGNPS
jgi:hypothetical protein